MIKTMKPLIVFLKLGTIALLLFSLAGFAGMYSWLLDLLAHFRMQYLYIAVAITVVWSIFKDRRYILLSIVIIIVNLYDILPYYFKDSTQAAKDAKSIKVLTYNVLSQSQEYKKVVKTILKYDADIVFLIETNQAWIDGVKEINQTYPYSSIKTREDNFGIALFSKYPLIKPQIINFTRPSMPSILTKVAFHGEELSLIATHSFPPIGRIYASWLRNLHLYQMSRITATMDRPTIVMGDLNITPFSPLFKTILQRANLKDSAIGFGLTPTWWRGIFGIPIDHILVSKDIVVEDRIVGESFGSDHHLVMATLKISF